MANIPAGERARFVSDPGADVLEMQLELEPVHHGPPAHVHPGAVESFEVTSGALELLVGRQWRRLEAGEQLAVSAGLRHTYRGLAGQSSRATVRITPGAAMRAFLTDLYGLAEQGRVDAEGSPRVREAARLFRAHPMAMTVAGVPRWLQQPLWRVIAARPS